MNEITIKLSDDATETIKEVANARDIDVKDLIAVIINSWVVQQHFLQTAPKKSDS